MQQKAGSVSRTLINLSGYEAGELIVEHNLNKLLY